MLQETINRFKQLSFYSPKRGLLNEGWNDVDTTGWVCVGEVAYDPWLKGIDKVYVMVDPQKTMKYGEYVNDIRYTENPDGSGSQTDSIPTYVKREIIVYPEHQDDEFGEMFLGKRKDKEVAKLMHDNFNSKLFKLGNNIVLHHNSSYKLTDGFIKKGKPNGWSNNTDIGIYFWASRSAGRDPSNNSTYTYYCIIPQEQLYDFSTNEERLSLRNAMSKYGYAGQFWKDKESIVVTTLIETPIWCILDKDTGKWYDKDWNEIEKPF